ncbi:hypothetical protein FDP41_013063 [Naegleria fowleri]|uniref:Uncharacterized protein n=1 Tax=Naegleria fowleri TaxID=5763 RepID=A0A6A5C3Z4_NAEFO|nr:uncharacterized protein FDP41_013063 [Naegleria fowleri]KAF0980580.1 hypothetical protein FDP41_013063 [Naegleria fowleri]CAG4709623.1 unnamed protein product [Naegleria fowleri]
MTNITSEHVTCAVCSKKSKQDILISTNSMGGSDLDLRPPPMKRDTMNCWLQRCEHCGYVSYDISVLPENDEGREGVSLEKVKEIIESDDYVEQLHDSSLSRLANTFLCYAILQDKGFGNYAASGWASLRAAWVCDDGVIHDKFNEEKHLNNAVRCRKKAIYWFEKCRSLSIPFVQQKGTEEMILTDLFRRCRMWDDADKELQRAQVFKDEIDDFVWKLIEYEMYLVKKQDTECHKVSDAQLNFHKDGDASVTNEHNTAPKNSRE